MHRNRTIAFLIAAGLSVLTATQVQAVQRTHVSAAIGNDTNSATGCTVVAPCRFFQAAMTVTDNNGEVVVLDSGGYGAVTLTQSVALIAPAGVYAGISVFSGANGVVIATPGVNVVLRGLTINGQGGANGIRMVAGNKLNVENCVISNLGASGISVTGPATVRVVDSIIRDSGSFGILLEDGALGTITRAVVSGSASVGVVARGQLPGSTTSISIADSIMDGNLSGVVATSENATATVNVSIRDSSAVGNSKNGLAAASNAGGRVKLTASNNMISNNQTGVAALTKNVKVWASGNTVSNNTGLGLFNDSANTFNDFAFETTGNNAVKNNEGGDAVGVITINAAK